MKPALALLALLLFTSCAPRPDATVGQTATQAAQRSGPGTTTATFKGKLCGQEAAFAVTDAKDRAGFHAGCTMPDGSSSVLESTDSNGSTSIQAALTAMQIQTQSSLTALTQMFAALLQAAGIVVKPAVAAAGGPLPAALIAH
jgi:hypothetical protein